MLILKAIKSHFQVLYDKQKFTLVVTSYKIYKTNPGLVSNISYEMTTHVRSSLHTTKHCMMPLAASSNIGSTLSNVVGNVKMLCLSFFVFFWTMTFGGSYVALLSNLLRNHLSFMLFLIV